MSVGSYFGTDEQKKAKNWDMLQLGKEQRANLSRLRHETRQLSISLREFSDAMGDCDSNVFRFEESSVTVLRRHPDEDLPGHTIAASEIAKIPTDCLNLDRIKTLLAELETSQRSLAVAVRELKDLGVNL